ncbi:MAG: outer membrane lipoprotein-sorting protein [Treponemataceae bacterium]|nr:outer membrane lipoprotein-sorting protein [Treponemataceae bacterium]
MKKILYCLILTLCIPSLFAANYEDLLKKAQDSTAFYGTDFSGNYTLVQEKPGEGKTITEAIMYRRDSAGKWTILVTGPANEKGKGYLQYDNNIWFYDPADNCFTFTSAKDKFQNTNATNSDFAPQRYYSDYSIQEATEVKLGKLACVQFTLKAKVEGVDYPMLKLWVTKDDGLVRKKEDYSLSGRKMRTTAVPSYQLVQSNGIKHSIPVSMLIQDNLRGKKIGNEVQYEKTQITIKNVSFQNVSDTVYTKPYLELMGAK